MVKMDIVKGRWRRSLASITRRKASRDSDEKAEKKCQPVAPEGCFSVYVGPQKQRFAMKAEFANHPLFKMLLEDAEQEYGYSSEGPIMLPCEVELFYKVLAEMESCDEISPSCSYGSFIPCSPSRRSSCSAKGYGPYSVLSPSRLLKLNRPQ